MPPRKYENGSNRELPFVEASIEEMDIEFRGDIWAWKAVRTIATDQGYAAEQLLYRGMDRSDIDSTGRFAHERYTESGSHPDAVWAFTDKEFGTSAAQNDRDGFREPSSPLFYALDTDEQPALVIMDGSKLMRLSEIDEQYHDAQFVARQGYQLEDAIIAVINITH